MANLKEIQNAEPSDKIAKLFDDYVIQEQEKQQGKKRRGYLGMSSIGGTCELKEFYNYRWCATPEFGPRTLRKFMDGHEAEPRVFDRLRAMGVEIWDIDDKGNQYVCKPKGFGGHFLGHLDGVAKGLPDFHPEEYVLIDVKISELPKFKKLVGYINEGSDNPLRDWNPDYWGQANMYMHAQDLSSAVYMVFTPGLLDCVTVSVKRDLTYAHSLHEKAKRIIFCKDLNELQKVSEDINHPDCFFCSSKKICYKKKLPNISCRTCIHASPDSEGEAGNWTCKFHGKKLDDFEVCSKGHLYHPQFFSSWAVVQDIADDESWIKFHNTVSENSFVHSNTVEGTDYLTSEEIKISYDLNEGPEFIE